MEKVIEEKKVKFVFSDGDFEMRSAFENAMNQENHWKRTLAFIIEQGQEKTDAAAHQWAIMRKTLKEKFPKDWPNGTSTITYSHPDRSFTVTLMERADDSSSKNKHGGKK